MKNFRTVLAVVAAVASMAVSMSSCSKEDNNYSYPNPNALVTVKTAESGETYFQVDEKTTLAPVDWKNPYKSEVRALVQYSEEPGNAGLFSKKVKVAWIDSVRTKAAVPYTEEFKKGESSMLSLYNDWVTCCEDGYLTIHFAAWFGVDRKVVHIIELGIDLETHDLYLRHDSNGDNGQMAIGDGIIAFKIDDLLKDVKDGEELTLHWKDYNGDRKAKVKYSSRFLLSKSER